MKIEIEPQKSAWEELCKRPADANPVVCERVEAILARVRERGDEALKAIAILPAMRSPTVMPLAAKGWVSLHSVVDAEELWEKVRQLKAIGAEGILVLNVDKIIP